MLSRVFLCISGFHAIKFVGLIKAKRSKVIGAKAVEGPAKDI
jgi:hypothetical protein